MVVATVVVVVVVVVGGIVVVVVEGVVVLLIISRPIRGFPPRLIIGLSCALATGLLNLPCPNKGNPSGLTIGAPFSSRGDEQNKKNLTINLFQAYSMVFINSGYHKNTESVITASCN